jgi:hypothetical protein
MAILRTTMLVCLLLAPGTALAHGPSAAPLDPPLHVDAGVKDCSVEFAPELTQHAFHGFVREFGSVSAFKQAAPPTTLGQLHVAADIEDSFFVVDEKSDRWNDTFAHPDAHHELGANKNVPKLRVRVGVTSDLDMGVFFTANPNANYGWIGLDAKYALLKQGASMPVTLALRAAYTKTLFVSDMDMHALTLDVSAGRTFWDVVTPYVGLGSDAVLARETSDAVELDDEALVAAHALVGAEARYWHVALGAEAHIGPLASLEVHASALF